MNLIKSLGAPVAALMVAAAALYAPQPIYAQDNSGEVSVKFGRWNKDKTARELNLIASDISNFPHKEPRAEFYPIHKRLSELLEKTDDEKMLYDANFWMARLIFKADQRSFSGIFDSFGECVIGYKEQEAKFGFAYDALRKIGERFSREGKLIGTALCYELASLSDYPKKDLGQLKAGLDRLLNKEVGDLPLKEALEKMFEGDGAEMKASYLYDDRYMKEFSSFRGNYIAPVPGEFAEALRGPTRRLDVKLEINPEGMFVRLNRTKNFPSINLRNVEVSSRKDSNPNALFICDSAVIDARNLVDPSGLESYFNGRSQEARISKCEERSIEISKEGVVVEPLGILQYASSRKRLDGITYPVSLRRIRIGSLLRMVGIDPYHWFYSGTTSEKTGSGETSSPKNIDW